MPQPAAERWRPIVRRARQSGLTMRAFARANGLNPSTLAWWSWRLGVDVKPSFAEPVEASFVEAVLDGPDRTAVLTVRVGAASLDVFSHTDLDLLRRVVGALT